MKIPYPDSDVIGGVNWLSKPMVYFGSLGDVWTCAWADDGEMYAVADDTRGIHRNAFSNLAVFKVSGSPPSHTVELVNPMASYGEMCEVQGMDTWKGNGLTCVDGVLYLAVSQHSGAYDYPDCVQRVADASIVKSEDHGKTWSAMPELNKPMFDGPRFATPFFVQFGQDYKDAMDDFVYAISCGGAWNNGSYMILGRVPRNKIASLRAADWEFFQGEDEHGRAKWTADVRKASGVFKNRNYTSMTGVQYVPAVKRFIMPQWAYCDPDADNPWAATVLMLFEAPKPWGPWRHFHTELNWGRASYNPNLPAKWFEEGGKKMWMVSAGDFTMHDQTRADFAYGFTTQKMELRLK